MYDGSEEDDCVGVVLSLTKSICIVYFIGSVWREGQTRIDLIPSNPSEAVITVDLVA